MTTIVSPLYGWGYWSLEKLYNLPTVGQGQEHKWVLSPSLYSIYAAHAHKGLSMQHVEKPRPLAQASSTLTMLQISASWPLLRPKIACTSSHSPSGGYIGTRELYRPWKGLAQGNLAGNSNLDYLEHDLKGKVWVPGGCMPATCGLLAPRREMQSRRTRAWLARVQGLVQGLPWPYSKNGIFAP